MVVVVNLHDTPCDVPVCRPSIYGNPFTHLLTKILPVGLHVATRQEAVSKFAHWFYSSQCTSLRRKALHEIGPDAKIGCHCAPLACHGDIIAGYLNWKRDYKFNSPKARTVLYVENIN